MVPLLCEWRAQGHTGHFHDKEHAESAEALFIRDEALLPHHAKDADLVGSSLQRGHAPEDQQGHSRDNLGPLLL